MDSCPTIWCDSGSVVANFAIDLASGCEMRVIHLININKRCLTLIIWLEAATTETSTAATGMSTAHLATTPTTTTPSTSQKTPHHPPSTHPTLTPSTMSPTTRPSSRTTSNAPQNPLGTQKSRKSQHRKRSSRWLQLLRTRSARMSPSSSSRNTAGTSPPISSTASSGGLPFSRNFKD